jgi:hypothetical protein
VINFAGNDYEGHLNYRMALLSFPSAQQLSLDILADAGFLHYEGAVLRETTNKTLCSMGYI